MKFAEHIRIQPIDDGGIIFDARSGQYSQINVTGLRVIRGVAAGDSTERIIDGLVSEFEVTREVAEQDVAACVATLLERGWLEVEER